MSENDFRYITQMADMIKMANSNTINFNMLVRTPGFYILANGYTIRKTLNPLNNTSIIGKVLITDISLMDAYCNEFGIPAAVKQLYINQFIENNRQYGYGFVIIDDYEDTVSSAAKVLKVLSSVKHAPNANVKTYIPNIVYNNNQFILVGKDSKQNNEFTIFTSIPSFYMSENEWQQVLSKVR